MSFLRRSLATVKNPSASSCHFNLLHNRTLVASILPLPVAEVQATFHLFGTFRVRFTLKMDETELWSL